LALEAEAGFEVAGHARDEDEARLLVKQVRPAGLLFDYEGLGPSAGPRVWRLPRPASGPRIPLLPTPPSQGNVERVLRVGAAGLVGKQQAFATLLRAFRAVAAGELWANRRATAHVVELLASPSDRGASAAERLTGREWDIADAVGQGLRNKDIAR